MYIVVCSSGGILLINMCKLMGFHITTQQWLLFMVLYLVNVNISGRWTWIGTAHKECKLANLENSEHIILQCLS